MTRQRQTVASKRRLICIATLFIGMLEPCLSLIIPRGLSRCEGALLRTHKAYARRSNVLYSNRTRPWPAQHRRTRMVAQPDEDWENAGPPEEYAFQDMEVSQVKNGAMMAGAVMLGVFVITQAASHHLNLETIESVISTFNLSDFLKQVVSTIKEEGPTGYLWFSLLYVTAEVLAVPALPLTASAGYLFGLEGGTAVVLFSATIAAGISFQLGRTYLRKWIERTVGSNPKFRAVDAAIAKEGFKIILLLRLSPIFPFALSNYLYGLTSVPFWPYLSASMLGFLPGTIAYVYGGGRVGQLVDGAGDGLPWQSLLVGLAFAAASIKIVGDIAMKAIAEIEPGIEGGTEQEWD